MFNIEKKNNCMTLEEWWYLKVLRKQTICKLLNYIPANGTNTNFKNIWSIVILNKKALDGFNTFTAQWFCQYMVDKDYIDIHSNYSDFEWLCNITPVGLSIKTNKINYAERIMLIITAISVASTIYFGFINQRTDDILNKYNKQLQELQETTENNQKEILHLKKEMKNLKDSIYNDYSTGSN